MLRSCEYFLAYWKLRCVVPPVYYHQRDILRKLAKTHGCRLSNLLQFFRALDLDSHDLSYHLYLCTRYDPAAAGNMQGSFEELEAALAEVVEK